jgi:transposase
MLGQASDETPAMLAAPDHGAPPRGSRQDRGGLIEIELRNGVRVRVDGFVKEKALRRVLRALTGAS